MSKAAAIKKIEKELGVNTVQTNSKVEAKYGLKKIGFGVSQDGAVAFYIKNMLGERLHFPNLKQAIEYIR